MLKATYTMVNTTSAVVWGVTSPYLGVVGGGVRGVRQRGVVKALKEVEEAFDIVEGHAHNGEHHLGSRVGRHVTIPGGEGWGRGWGGGEGVDEVSRQA
jgi:hypothetical protein